MKKFFIICLLSLGLIACGQSQPKHYVITLITGEIEYVDAYNVGAKEGNYKFYKDVCECEVTALYPINLVKSIKSE